jgi:excisionase family DNA binding protein
MEDSQPVPLAIPVNEATVLLRTCRSTIYKGIRTGRIPVIHVCGMVRIPRAWIEAEIQKALDSVAANSDKTAA